MIGVEISVAVTTLAAAIALLAVRRRSAGSADALTMQLSLALVQQDQLLVTAGREQWWGSATADELHAVERELATWDLAAWYAASGRVDRAAILELFGAQIVDVWERAYPYVQHRRIRQPQLWCSLAELYLDAYDGAAATRPAGGDAPSESAERSTSPDDAPADVDSTASQLPAGDLTPPVAVDAAEPEPEKWAEALRRARGTLPLAGPLPPRSEPLTRLRASLAQPAAAPEAGPRQPSYEHLQPPSTIEQVIDLTEVAPASRGPVAG